MKKFLTLIIILFPFLLFGQKYQGKQDFVPPRIISLDEWSITAPYGATGSITSGGQTIFVIKSISGEVLQLNGSAIDLTGYVSQQEFDNERNEKDRVIDSLNTRLTKTENRLDAAEQDIFIMKGGGIDLQPVTGLFAFSDNDSAYATLGWTLAGYSNGTSDSLGIERALSNSTAWVRIDTVLPNNTIYTDNTVIGGLSYWYRIISLRDGYESISSNLSGVITITDTSSNPVFLAPVLIATTAGTIGSVNLSWTQPGSAPNYYSVQYNNGTWHVIILTTNTSYTATGFSPGVSYGFRVGAGNSDSTLIYSSTKTVVIPVPNVDTLDFRDTIYVAANGNPSFNGQTAATAMNWTGFLNYIKTAGYYFRFKGGDIFPAGYSINYSGTAGEPIKFGTYGTGMPTFGDSLTYQPSGLWNQTINISGSHIILDSLIIRGGNPSQGTANGVSVLGSNVTIQNCLIAGGNRSVYGGSSGIAINASVRNSKVYNNEIHSFCYGVENYGGANIIWSTSDSVYIGRNKIHHIWRIDGSDSDGIRVLGSNQTQGDAACDYKGRAVVEYNEIYEWGEDAMDFNGAAGVTIQYNNIHDAKLNYTRTDFGPNAFKVGGTQPSAPSHNMKFRYNIIHDIWAPQQSTMFQNSAWGGGYMRSGEIAYNLVYNIYGSAILSDVPNYPPWDNLTSDADSLIKIYNNTFITGSSAMELWDANSRVEIKNNILKSNTKVAGHSYTYLYPRNSTETAQIWHGTDNMGGIKPYDLWLYLWNASFVYVDANILANDAAEFNLNPSPNAHIGNTKANLYATNPLFTDTTTDNYTLQAGSPAINYGLGLGYTRDLANNAINSSPDVGAYEFTVTDTSAPSLSNLTNASISSTSQQVTSSVNWNYANTTVYDHYRVTGVGSYDSVALGVTVSSTGLFSKTITGLTANTTYQYWRSAYNSKGYIATAVSTFTTAVSDLGCDPPVGDLFLSDRGCFENGLIYSWTWATGTGTITTSTDYAKHGTNSLKIVVASSVGVNANIWVRASSGTELDNEILTTTPTQYTLTFTATTTNYDALGLSMGGGQNPYIFLSSFTDLSTSLTIGATYTVTFWAYKSSDNLTVYIDDLSIVD